MSGPPHPYPASSTPLAAFSDPSGVSGIFILTHVVEGSKGHREARWTTTMAKTDYRLSSDVEIANTPLSGLIGGSAEETQVFGRVYMSTTGEFLVPNEWLAERLSDIGFKEHYIPPEPSDLRAYHRAMGRLIDPEHEEAKVEGRRVNFRLTEGDDRQYLLRADVFRSREERGSEVGKEESFTIGVFDYVADTGSDGVIADRLRIVAGEDLENVPILRDSWEIFVLRAQSLIQKCKTHNTGKDLQNFMSYFNNHWSQAVKVRHGGGAYFIPESEAHLIEGLAEVYTEIDEEYKETSMFHTEIRTFPVFDDKDGDHAAMIERAVQERLEDTVEGAVDSAWEVVQRQLEDGEVVRQAVKEALDGVEDAKFTADTYNNLLNVELAVRRSLEQRLTSIPPEERKHIEEALYDRFGDDV